MDGTSRIAAAQYLRMSTEHQQYSMENQAAAIQDYASTHGFIVVQSYYDLNKYLRKHHEQILRDLSRVVEQSRMPPSNEAEV